ncbi:MAG: DEAD/DEAH box helicase [Candidatus Bathyarchaeia archaeon]
MNAFHLLSKSLIEALRQEGIDQPTRIQEQSIPVILSGRSALLIAPTGTGKTEAACIPVFELFLRARTSAPPKGISILYLTPLRALNRDIFRRLLEVGERIGLEVQVRHGDTGSTARRIQALKPPSMLITTPETLQAILPGKRMREHLRHVRWVIVDEIHELVGDERGAQLSLGLERLEELSPHSFQRIGISATVGEPQLVGRFLTGGRDVTIVKAASPKEVSVWVETPTPTSEDEKEAERLLISAGSVARMRRLLNLMETRSPMLIFTNTREHAEALASRMLSMRPDLKIGIHHGSLSREARIKTEKGLREGDLKAVICTSSLELGIDVGNLEFVAHYMSPRQATRLVHRIGRSGHHVDGRSSGCIIAASPDDILEAGVLAKRMMEGRLERPQMQRGALDVLAHQLAGLSLDKGRLPLAEALGVIRRALPFRHIGVEELDATVAQLSKTGTLRQAGDSISRGRKLHEYYFRNISMIPDVEQYAVYDFIGRRSVGTLDQEFVGRNGVAGTEFIMHGQTWRILSVDEEEHRVDVEPVRESLGAIPSWEGEMIPVPMEVAEEVGRLREEVADQLRGGGDPRLPLKPYPLTEEAKSKVVDYVRRQIEEGFEVPGRDLFVAEAFERFIVLHSCAGDTANQALGRALAAVLSGRFGIAVGVYMDAYRIAFMSGGLFSPEDVVKELSSLRTGDVRKILEATLPETSLFAWRVWQVAKRFGIVERGAEYKLSVARTIVKALMASPVHEEAVRELLFEKLDIEAAEKVASRIRRGKVKVVVSRGSQPYSPMAYPILDQLTPHDLLRPALPTHDVAALVKERLENEKVKLVCLAKNDWEAVYPVRLVKDPVRCARCGSALVAVTYRQDFELQKILSKRQRRAKLTPEEERKFLTAWRSANIVQSYGRRGVLVLAGRGIGPTTATRILRGYRKDEEELYHRVLKAERDYIRTKPFWD